MALRSPVEVQRRGRVGVVAVLPAGHGADEDAMVEREGGRDCGGTGEGNERREGGAVVNRHLQAVGTGDEDAAVAREVRDEQDAAARETGRLQTLPCGAGVGRVVPGARGAAGRALPLLLVRALAKAEHWRVLRPAISRTGATVEELP